MPIVGCTVTYDYHYTDPHCINTLNPNNVRIRKLVLGYDGSLAMEYLGLFPQYVERVTVNDIARAKRDDRGNVEREIVNNNGLEGAA